MEFGDLARISGAFVQSRLLQAAVDLGIFEALREGPLSAEALATAVRSDPRATWVLANALVAIGLLERHAQGYTNGEAAQRWLVPGAPEDFTGMVRFDAMLWSVWAKLEQTIRTGEPARRPDMFQSDPRETERFILAMDALVRARGDARVLAGHPVVASARRLLDIGSGPGTYPIAFCEAHPDLQATIVDLPATLEVTRKVVERSPARDRIALVAGDYRKDPLPGGQDLVLLSNIIHSEDEATNRALMLEVHAALRPGGWTIIKDHVLADDGCSPLQGALFSVQMLLTTRGRDYTRSEIRSWIVDAGFEEPSVEALSLPLTSALVLAQKPGA